MDELVVRPMSDAEFADFRSRTIREYAAQHVEAGDWAEAGSVERAERETDGLLPQAQHTPGMLLLTAEVGTEAGPAQAGLVWVALQGSGPAGQAWIYSIEILPEYRGRGYSRTLLAAAEQEAARQGATAIGLNVFGPNQVARGLYESSGYGIIAMQLVKPLDAAS